MLRSGEIVLLPFPFSDASTAKRRPAFVLTDEDELGDFSALAITSRSIHEDRHPLTQDDLVDGYLPVESWVRTSKVYTLHDSLVVGSIGHVQESVRRQISGALLPTYWLLIPRQTNIRGNGERHAGVSAEFAEYTRQFQSGKVGDSRRDRSRAWTPEVRRFLLSCLPTDGPGGSEQACTKCSMQLTPQSTMILPI